MDKKDFLPALVISLLAVRQLGAPVPARAAAPQEPKFAETLSLGYQTGGVTAASWGDFDGDGFLDLAIQGANSYVTIYRNQRDGAFTKYHEFLQGSTGGYHGLDWGDFDRDGDLDLAVGSFYPGQSYLYINEGGSFTQTPQFGSTVFQNMDLEWGDYDNDGDLDLAEANNTSQSYLYVNDGAGSFTRVPQFGNGSKQFAWGDYDGDGDLDLAAASSSDSITFRPNYLWVNNGDGTFQQVPQFGISRHSASLAWGDCDGDGDLDLALGNENPYGNSNPQNQLYRNNGDGTFTPSPQFGRYGQGLAWADFDLDGAPDLAVGSSLGNRLYVNQGDCTFTEYAAFGDFGRNVAWGDYDNDGDPDLVTRDFIYTNQLVRNHPPVAVCQDITVAADPDCRAEVVFGNSYDPDGDPISMSQAPPSPYPWGTTAVTLTVTDDKGEASTCSAMVSVIDNTPPAISCPADQSMLLGLGITSAAVDYPLPLSTDACSPAAVTCAPPPGASFPVGTTAVTCMATDGAGNAAACMFLVTLTTPQGATEEIGEDVGQLVEEGVITEGTGNALLSKLEAAIQQLDRGNVNAAINQLKALIQQVEGLIAAGSLASEQGQALIDAAEQILRRLGV